MAEQRQPFRFRLPWLPAPAGPRPNGESQAPNQPNATTPAQRPPFRPPGVARVQPAQVQAPKTESQPPSPSRAPRTESQPPSPSRAPRTESQPPSPSRTSTQPQTESQPPTPTRRPAKAQTELQPSSPSQAPSQTRAASQPTSPSRAPTQLREASQPPSPLQPTSQPSAASQPPSLSRPATQIPPSRPSPKPKSPPRMASQSPGATTLQSQASSTPDITIPDQPIKLSSPPNEPKPIAEELSQPAPISTHQPSSSASQQEAKLEGYQSLTQEPQAKPEVEVSLEIAQETQKQTPTETAELDGMITQPPVISDPIGNTSPMPNPATDSPPQNSDSSAITNVSKPLPEIEERPKEIKKEPELMREEIMDHALYEETKPTTVDELPTAASETQPIQQVNAAFEAEEKQLQKQEISAKEEGLTSAGSDGLQIKAMTSTNPKNKVILSDSCPNPARSNGEQASAQKQLKDDITRIVNNMALGNPKQPIDERPIIIITLTGENKGAFMNMASESVKKEAQVHIHRGYKSISDESTQATTDGERSPKAEHLKDPRGKEESAKKAYINSNVQSINNSILFYGSVTQRNPGVHLLFSQRTPAPVKTYSQTETVENKDEFTIIPAEKLTYEPKVRRRCLRGLFMEPSDSDPDNPDKPHRHGCRYNCKEKHKANEVDIL